MSDLDALIAAVEAGGEWRNQDHLFGRKRAYAAKCAYHGSLDAAKRLHDALLPGWAWCVIPNGASVYSAEDNSPIDADIDNPARAWLLAILRAVKAKGEQG